MQIGQRDKLALWAAGIALTLFVAFKFAVFPIWDSLQEGRVNWPIEEKKLEKYRAVAQTVGLRNAEASTSDARLRAAESSLLTNKTAALASAELQDIVKQLTAADSIEVRSSEFLPAKPLGGDYMEVPVGLQFQCHLDELVNFLKNTAESPKYLTVPRLLIQPGAGKEKIVTVNMQIAGIMRAEPEAGSKK